MTPVPKNCGALPPRLKNYPELGEGGHFLYGATHLLGGGVISLAMIVAQTQNYNII